MMSYETPAPINGQSANHLDIAAPATMESNSSLATNPAPINQSAGPITAQNTVAKADGAPPSPTHHHIWLVTGPAGCGKTTVAEHLSQALGLPYLEGDEYHPQANIDKMASGQPLTDSDRWDWLTLLRNESLARLSAGHPGVVLTCSALKRKYRDVIRVAPYYLHDVVLHFIYLHAPQEVLLERVLGRKGHYMGANMVASQFSALEPPTAEETDVISIDVTGPQDGVKVRALELAKAKMAELA